MTLQLSDDRFYNGGLQTLEYPTCSLCGADAGGEEDYEFNGEIICQNCMNRERHRIFKRLEPLADTYSTQFERTALRKAMNDFMEIYLDE